MVAGVAGGIAEYADIDPLLVRATLAVLTVFGGIGVLLYALGWLLLPVAGEQASLGESLVRTGRYGNDGHRVRPVLLAAGLVIVVFAVGSSFLDHNRDNLLLLATVVVLGVLLHRHLRDRPPAGDPPAEQPQQPALFTPTGQPVDVTTQSLAAVSREADRLAAEQLAAEDRGMHGPWPPVEQQPDPPRVPPVGRITLAALVMVLGAVAAIDRSGAAHVSASAFFASGLAVIGVGLVVGAYHGGRVRWLVVLAIPFLLALLVARLVPMDRDGDFTSRRWHPATTADIHQRYQLNGGTANLDLSGVDFRDRTVTAAVQVSAGRVEVTVPPTVDVTVHSRGNVGDLTVLGRTSSGLRLAKTVHDDGPDGEGGGRLDLTVKVGVGDVEVHRATS